MGKACWVGQLKPRGKRGGEGGGTNRSCTPRWLSHALRAGAATSISCQNVKDSEIWLGTSVKRHAGKSPGKRRENAGLIYSGIIRVDDRDRAIAPYRTVDP